MWYFIISFIAIILFFRFLFKNGMVSKFTDKQITGFVMQSFETAHILKHTKKLETFKSRYVFFKERHSQLVELKPSFQFNNAFQNAVRQYRQKYYDLTLNGTIKEGLYEPQTFDVKYFFENCLINCLKESIADDYKKIAELKTEKAKQNRLEKINIKIDAFLEYLESEGYQKEDAFYKELYKIRQAE